VVELGVWVAGPACGGIMADWGADVIKVEPPTGDPQRAVFGALGVKDQSGVPPFEIDNRGKKSVVIDLRTEAGIGQMLTIMATADVFVTNLRHAALQRLGLDPVSLRERFPKLVYGIISGFGLDGPDAHRPGYDVGGYWARSGLAHTMVPPGEEPVGLRSGQGDHVTGMSLAAGVCAALFDAQRSGQGRMVSTSLLRNGMYNIGWDIGIHLRFGKRESTRSRANNRAPLINSYTAGDGMGFWLLGLEADRHWPALVASIDSDELRVPEFETARLRAQNNVALIEIMDRHFAQRPLHDWTELFDKHDVWWAPVNSIADVIVDPQARAAGGFVSMTPRAGEEPYEAVNTPVDFDGYALLPGPVPALGEHTSEVLGP
jgi:crotonobetainyl-CoA:carnitine CoA-transferase CaiB-like acyl-CoA transferase